MKTINSIIILITSVFLTSCTTTQKLPYYHQGVSSANLSGTAKITEGHYGIRLSSVKAEVTKINGTKIKNFSKNNFEFYMKPGMNTISYYIKYSSKHGSGHTPLETVTFNMESGHNYVIQPYIMSSSSGVRHGNVNFLVDGGSFLG